MKTTIRDRICQPGHGSGVCGRTAALVAGLALTVLAVPSGSGGILLYQETFDSDPHWWGGNPIGSMWVNNGQARLLQARMAPTDPDGFTSSWASFAPAWAGGTSNWNVRIQPGHTVELRTDVVGFNQDDAFAGLGVGAYDVGNADFMFYILALDRNEITLIKNAGGPGGFFFSFFFWDQVTHPGTNLILSAAFTQVEADLAIRIRVLDKTQANAVLYDRTVWDTAGQDPMLPNRAVKGIRMDPEEIIAPCVGIDVGPFVGVWYGDTTNAPSGVPYVTIDNVQVWETQAPVADASASRLSYISPNGVNASVTLDGSRSSDPDGDVLEYLWLSTLNSQPSTVLASGVQAVVVLPVGTHPIELVVNDGMATDTNAITVEVITTAQAVERLIAQAQSEWRRSQPLVATLYAALHSIERGNSVAALNQLRAFQNKVRAQLARRDPALAESFIQMAQEIIEALGAGNSKPAPRHGGLISPAR